MINRSQMRPAIRLAVISGAIAAALLGCQPASNPEVVSTPDDKAIIETNPSKSDEHGHQDNEHNEDAAEHDHAEHSGHDHSGHDHASKSTVFECQPQATIGVYYHNDMTPQTAHLIIDEIEYDLTARAPAETTQQTYVSDIGLDDKHGIIWQVDGHHATLRNKTLEDTIALEQEQLLFDCQQAAE